MQGDVLQPKVQRDPAFDEPAWDQGGDWHLGGRDDHPRPEVQVGDLLLQMLSIWFGLNMFMQHNTYLVWTPVDINQNGNSKINED